VHLPDGFSYRAWMKGLGEGRSFVTTGPMLNVTTDGAPMGSTLNWESAKEVRVRGMAESAVPLRTVEIIVNGQIVRSVDPVNNQTKRGGFRSPFDLTLPLTGSSWIAVRVFEKRADHRIRFAHSSPVHIDIKNKPLRPRQAEVGYLVQRMEEELENNRSVLKPAQLDEYKEALEVYKEIAKTAR
jgi:hypothetical protein